MRKLLITGGAGFIGSNFVTYWYENHPDDKIIVLDNLTYSGRLKNIPVLQRKRLKMFWGALTGALSRRDCGRPLNGTATTRTGGVILSG
jgi:dTDP-D-glucose 4,6-dehydratase